LQAEGRGRAVRRTEQNRLYVLILTDSPLGIEINELVTEDAVMNDASFPAWLVASGVLPDLSGRGYGDFFRGSNGHKSGSREGAIPGKNRGGRAY
jgi:hypothetical protein